MDYKTGETLQMIARIGAANEIAIAVPQIYFNFKPKESTYIRLKSSDDFIYFWPILDLCIHRINIKVLEFEKTYLFILVFTL